MAVAGPPAHPSTRLSAPGNNAPCPPPRHTNPPRSTCEAHLRLPASTRSADLWLFCFTRPLHVCPVAEMARTRGSAAAAAGAGELPREPCCRAAGSLPASLLPPCCCDEAGSAAVAPAAAAAAAACSSTRCFLRAGAALPAVLGASLPGSSLTAGAGEARLPLRCRCARAGRSSSDAASAAAMAAARAASPPSSSDATA